LGTTGNGVKLLRFFASSVAAVGGTKGQIENKTYKHVPKWSKISVWPKILFPEKLPPSRNYVAVYVALKFLGCNPIPLF